MEEENASMKGEDDFMDKNDILEDDFNMDDFIKDLAVTRISPSVLDMLRYQFFDREKLLKMAFEFGEIHGFTRKRIEDDLLKLAFLASFKSDCYNDLYRSRSNATEKKWLSEVKTVYNLRVKPCKIPNCITLRRLAVTYARELSLQLHEKNILPCIDPDSLTPGFPAAMCLSTFACLIPNALLDNEREIFKKAFCYFRLAYDKFAYPQPQRRFTKKEIEIEVRRRSYGVPYPEEEKVEHSLKVELIVKEGDKYIINPAIKPSLEEASLKWETL